MEIRLDLGLILAVIGALITLGGLYWWGTWYDRKVDEWTAQRIDEGYVAYEVALGVAVTVTAVTPWFWVISTLPIAPLAKAALIYLALVLGFIADGVPMIRGDMRRYIAKKLNSR